MPSRITIEITDDGVVKINARDLEGTEAEILAELTALAREVGGELKVERHEPGQHHHSHDHGHGERHHRH